MVRAITISLTEKGRFCFRYAEGTAFGSLFFCEIEFLREQKSYILPLGHFWGSAAAKFNDVFGQPIEYQTIYKIEDIKILSLIH